MKRNPFKKTPQSSNKSVSNEFKHLTESAMGFDSQETPDIEFDMVDEHSSHPTAETNGKENSISGNNAPKVSGVFLL